MVEEMRRSHPNITRVEIKEEEVEWAVKFVPNWKAPGPDKIQGFWIKYLELKKILTRHFNRWLRDGVEERMLEGRTSCCSKEESHKK